jgi:hypothetical protein
VKDDHPRRTWLVVGLAVVLGLGIGIGNLINRNSHDQRVAEVATRGAQVMPFDLDRTTHLFDREADGGVQSVTADDPNDAEQIRLIRDHLRHEADAFSRGDFSDPARIHGEDMPGLATLRRGADKIEVAYSDLPNGAQITYVSGDVVVVHALHEWFEAQLSDHGDHAEGDMQH